MDAYPREAWARVGNQLVTRRGQLDPRYIDRQVFAAEVGLNYGLIRDIEKNRRPGTYRPATIAAYENAYQLEPGAIEHALAGGGDLIPAPGSPGRRLAAVEDLPPTVYPDIVGDDPFLRRIWDDPFAPEEEKMAAIRGVIEHRLEVRRELLDNHAPRPAPGERSETGPA